MSTPTNNNQEPVRARANHQAQGTKPRFEVLADFLEGSRHLSEQARWSLDTMPKLSPVEQTALQAANTIFFSLEKVLLSLGKVNVKDGAYTAAKTAAQTRLAIDLIQQLRKQASATEPIDWDHLARRAKDLFETAHKASTDTFVQSRQRQQDLWNSSMLATNAAFHSLNLDPGRRVQD